MPQRRPLLGIVLAILVVLISFSPQFKSFYSMPTFLKLGVGEELGINLKLPTCLADKLKVEVDSNPKDLLNLTNTSNNLSNFLQAGTCPIAVKPGEANLKLKLFGFIPVKNVNVDVQPRIELVPGGHAIGILLKTQGVTVIGFAPVKDETGEEHMPGEEAGLMVGDIIETVNGTPVVTDEETAKIIDNMGSKGKPIALEIKRGNQQKKLMVNPVKCRDTNRYRIGLYIRDNAAGVGTLTFYHPETQVYGALGHVIADVEINRQIAHGDGKIVNAAIQGIHQARRGQPGEKIGTFENSGTIFGDIRKNTNFGIFGFMNRPIKNDIYRKPLPVAYGHQVKLGPAEILTVIEGNKIEKFSIEIEKINPQRLSHGKNLVIKITDPRLLEVTGGIIQGMSGSPIIQNGYLVGAVTHVLVNEPSRGYGILAEWMLTETDLIKDAKEAA